MQRAFLFVIVNIENYICVIMAQVTKRELFELVSLNNGLFDESNGKTPYCSKKTAAVLTHRHNKHTLGDETYDQIAFHFGFSKETLYTKR